MLLLVQLHGIYNDHEIIVFLIHQNPTFAQLREIPPEPLGLYPYRFRVYPLQNYWFIPNFAA